MNLSTKSTVVLVALALLMVLVSHQVGLRAQSAQSAHSEQSVPGNDLDLSESKVSAPENRYLFGVSLGLQGLSLIYGLVAGVFCLIARTKARPYPDWAIALGCMAIIAFILSYAIDGVFV